MLQRFGERSTHSAERLAELVQVAEIAEPVLLPLVIVVDSVAGCEDGIVSVELTKKATAYSQT